MSKLFILLFSKELYVGHILGSTVLISYRKVKGKFSNAALKNVGCITFSSLAKRISANESWRPTLIQKK